MCKRVQPKILTEFEMLEREYNEEIKKIVITMYVFVCTICSSSLFM